MKKTIKSNPIRKKWLVLVVTCYGCPSSIIKCSFCNKIYRATSHFNYCSETWHFYNKNNTAKLEKVNELALRFVLNEKQTSYCELLDKIGLPSLANQRLAKIVCTVFKAINSEHAPRSIKEPIAHINSYYDLRGNDILKLPKANITTT